MPPARFLEQYWQKHPLLIRQAFPGFPAAAGRRTTWAAWPARKWRCRASSCTTPQSDTWELHQGPFDEDDFAQLPDDHWTLLVQDVDKWDADVAHLLDPFRFLPSWRIDDVMVSYAEDGGGVGRAHRPVRRVPAAGHGPAPLVHRHATRTRRRISATTSN